MFPTIDVGATTVSALSLLLLLVTFGARGGSGQQGEMNDYLKREHSLIRPYQGKWRITLSWGRIDVEDFWFLFDRLRNDHPVLGLYRVDVRNEQLRPANAGLAVQEWGNLESDGEDTSHALCLLLIK